MDADEDSGVSRLRSSLQLVLLSRSPVPDVHTWCQHAFPGSCYLSCAVSSSNGQFATTCNLLERSAFHVELVSGQDAPLQLPTDGLLLHSSWPRHHPNLQTLWRSHHWESVIVVTIPSANETATASAAQAVSTAPHADMNGFGPGSDHGIHSSEMLPNGHAPRQQPGTDAEQANGRSEAVLILGLIGQRHDLERTLVKLQGLARQLVPIMHDQRQPLIDQALHAANDAAAAATAVGTNSHSQATSTPVPNGTAATAESDSATSDDAASTADGADATAAAAMLRNAATPFATTSGIAIPIPTMPVMNGERPGRRQEQSGSLPLDQMLSRNPSPIGSMPSGNSLPSLDRHYSDSMVSRQSSAQPSRLGSMADPSREESTGHGSLLDAAAATAVAAAAAFDSGIPLPPPRPLATVYSGQGLPPDSRKWSYDQEHSVSSLSAQDLTEIPGEVLASRDSESGAKPSLAASEGAARTAVMPDDSARASFESSWSHGGGRSAEAASEAQGRRMEKQRQHPWLLYFYDRDLEQDYSRYHAKQMTKVLTIVRTGWSTQSDAKVDAVSLIICVIIYLHLGFSSGHGYAYRVPLTCGLTLTVMLSIVLCNVLYISLHALIGQVDAVSLIICVILYPHLGFYTGHGYAHRVPLTFGLTLTVMLSIAYTVLYTMLHTSLHALIGQVDAVSLIICVIIYLHLGFSSGHGYAHRVPLTFGLTLAVMLSIVYTVLYMQDRWVSVREVVLRLGGSGYLVSSTFFLAPAVLKPASIAQLHGLSFLARYSNTSTLVTTSATLMVRFHIHMPCQLINFAMSAAVLPNTICQAGFPQYSPWKCISTGIAAQFLVGVVLSSIIVALNERRLRGMYLRSISPEGSANTKPKSV